MKGVLRSHLPPSFMPHPSESSPQTYPIVCLECRDSYLYAEVIQLVDPPQRSWLRPLWLRVLEPSNPAVPASQSHGQPLPHLYDLQGSPDLLWYQTAFRAALDTEILPLLTAFPPESDPCGDNLIPADKPAPEAQQQLRHFLQQLWQTQADNH